MKMSQDFMGENVSIIAVCTHIVFSKSIMECYFYVFT